MKDWYVFHSFSGMASGLRLFVASVGVIAMHLLSCSYAIADYPIVVGLKLTADQVTRGVLEGNPVAFQMTVQNISGYRIQFLTPTYTYFPNSDFGGDSGDAIRGDLVLTNDPTDTILESNDTVDYGITAYTDDDGTPWNDGPGHWKISAYVSGFAVDDAGEILSDPVLVTSTGDNLLYVTVKDPTPEPTPEPGTYALMGIGGLLMAFWLKKSGAVSAFTAYAVCCNNG